MSLPRIESTSQLLYTSLRSSLYCIINEIAKDLANLTSFVITSELHIPEFPLKRERGVIKAREDHRTLLRKAHTGIVKAYKLLNKGLEDEAGEEAWRAAINAINALSVALWNYQIVSHYTLSKFVDVLKEENIVDILVEYGNASSLHQNYYQPHFGRKTVEANIRQVQRLIEKIEEAIYKYRERKGLSIRLPTLVVIKFDLRNILTLALTPYSQTIMKLKLI